MARTRNPAGTPATNKLNVYLIKDGYTNYDSIIKQNPVPGKVALGRTGNLYFNTSHPAPPDWLADFFLNNQNIPANSFLMSGSSAVLICKVSVGVGYRFFAIPFGSGRHLLQDHAEEERFGLITTLNLVPADRLRSIDKHVVSTNPKLAREQLSRLGTAADFDIDIEKDLLHGITAQPSDPIFGKTVSGKEHFTFSARVNINNIHEYLRECYRYYRKRVYKTTFPWIDQLKEVNDPDLILQLEEELVSVINTIPHLVWLAVPDIINWSEISGFKYSTRRRDEAYDDLSIDDFLSETGLEGTFTTNDLRNYYITCWPADGEHFNHKWDAYDCLNAEVTIAQHLYILSNGKWYDIAPNFVTAVKRAVARIPALTNISLPEYAHADEAAYNIDLAHHLAGRCLDADNISYGGGMSRIEFCDVLAPGKKLIHVKRYGGSSVLSHLFNQGSVSADLLAGDLEFRKALRRKLPSGSFRNMIPVKKPNASQYKIVFVIIGDRSPTGQITIPFFSQITLRRCYQHLTNYNFKVYLNFVPLQAATP